MNWGCTILLLGMLAGIAAVGWLLRQPVVCKEPRRAMATLAIAVCVVFTIIVSVEWLVSRGATSVDQCAMFVFGQCPAHAVLCLVVFAAHDRVSRPRFIWLVACSFAASLIAPVAVIAAWHNQSIDGPAFLGLALASSIPAMPYIGLGLAILIGLFALHDRRIRRGEHSARGGE